MSANKILNLWISLLQYQHSKSRNHLELTETLFGTKPLSLADPPDRILPHPKIALAIELAISSSECRQCNLRASTTAQTPNSRPTHLESLSKSLRALGLRRSSSGKPLENFNLLFCGEIESHSRCESPAFFRVCTGRHFKRNSLDQSAKK